MVFFPHEDGSTAQESNYCIPKMKGFPVSGESQQGRPDYVTKWHRADYKGVEGSNREYSTSLIRLWEVL